jgi:hypothetical protein
MTALTLLRTLRARDAARRGLPGEHLAAATAGAWLLRRAPQVRSPLLRVAAYAGGALLLVRAASGRDGLRRFTRC